MRLLQKPTRPLLGLVMAFAGALLFSTKAILVKKAFAATGVGAVPLLALRMAFAAPFYLAVALWVRRQNGPPTLTRRQWLATFAIGLTGYYLSSLFDFIGLQYISAGLERLILFLYPTFAVLLNRLLFRQPIEHTQWLALLLTYAGIALAFWGEVQMATADDNLWRGSVWVLLCALTFAVYLVGSGRVIPRVGAVAFTAYAMLSATVGVLLHFLLTVDSGSLPLLPTLLPYGLLLAVVATVVPSFLVSTALRRSGSNNVAIVSSIGPVSTILQAHFFLGEEIFAEQLAGTALVLCGVLLLGWRKAKN